MIRVLIADESPRITENIVKRLEREGDITVCGNAKDGEYAVQEALRLQPDVAIIDAGLPGMDGVQTTEMLAQYLPRTGVIMMSMEGENEAYRHAMLAGAREFLQKPFKGDDLVAAVRRVHAFEQRKAVPQPTKVESGGATTGPSEGTGKVITVFSGKGGVGKSALAANLAVVLARKGVGKVALVDCSLQFGDIGALLNLAADRTIADLAANDAVADRDVIQQVLVDGPEGVRVLLAPISPELADYVTTQHLRALMEELRRTFTYIIVDSSSYLNEISLDAIEMADRVLLITDMSVTAVKNTRLVLTVMEVLKIDRERFLIVANHRDGHSELERTYAENFLKNPIAVEVPYEPGVVATSISHGVPFVVTNPQSPVTLRLEELAGLLTPETAPAGEPVAAGAGDDKNKKKQRRLLGFARS